jgi:hypothetical protein
MASRVSQIIQFYILQDKPLDGMIVFHTLEPLMGTSFLRVAIDELRIHIEERKSPSITANDLVCAFFGTLNFDEVREVKDAARQDEATIALHSLSSYAIGLDEFLSKEWLEADEMMLLQTRWDRVYYDIGRTRTAFTHTCAQWQFYKEGHYLHTISESRIIYLDEEGKSHFPR